MKQEYQDYIDEWGKETGEERAGNCINVSVQMVTNFPELRLCIGYALNVESGLVFTHCWVADGDDYLEPSDDEPGEKLYLEWKGEEHVNPSWVGMLPLAGFSRMYTKRTGKEIAFRRKASRA